MRVVPGWHKELWTSRSILLCMALDSASSGKLFWAVRSRSQKSNWASSMRHRKILAFLYLPWFLVSYINQTDLWTVTIIKWRPAKKYSHFLTASTTANACFSSLALIPHQSRTVHWQIRLWYMLIIGFVVTRIFTKRQNC